jgi:hypothetical protein
MPQEYLLQHPEINLWPYHWGRQAPSMGCIGPRGKWAAPTRWLWPDAPEKANSKKLVYCLEHREGITVNHVERFRKQKNSDRAALVASYEDDDELSNNNNAPMSSAFETRRPEDVAP